MMLDKLVISLDIKIKNPEAQIEKEMPGFLALTLASEMVAWDI